jgi:hypothetical protein
MQTLCLTPSNESSSSSESRAQYCLASELLPSFIANDIICCGMSVLMADRFVDFSGPNIAPVKEVAAEMISFACSSCDRPGRNPAIRPSMQPSIQPSLQSSTQPTMQPSIQPTQQLSSQPSQQPSKQPRLQPSRNPSIQPLNQLLSPLCIHRCSLQCSHRSNLSKSPAETRL